MKTKINQTDKKELKTLKDLNQGKGIEIDGRVFSNGKIDIYELQQEAIKWVKQHRNIKPNWAKQTNEEFFMDFFNLTEENLL